MRRQKKYLQLLILTIVLTFAMTVALFGSTPNAQAQDIPTATPTPEVEIQIVGGGPAAPGEYPWQIALIDSAAPANEFYYYPGQFCGGSLIHPLWVLTAGHCVTENNGTVSLVTSIDVVAGLYDLLSPQAGFQRRDVIQIIRHPSYDDYSLNNDIALLKLSSPVTIGGSGQTMTAVIPLVPSSVGSLAGVDASVTGWGKIATDPDDWDTELYEVQLPIISNSVCSDPNHYGGGITANMLCAGYDTGGYDACQGDSGGPLVVNNTGPWKLAGIVSWGVGCGEPFSPGVYTRVSQYVSWVNSQVDLIGPVVSGSVRASANPTFAATVNFTVTFSESVTGVDLSDFVLTTSGVSGAALNGISGSGNTYTVTVGIGSGEGTIRLDVIDNDSIVDGGTNLLGGTGAGNGNFTSGQFYTVDRTPPDVLSILRTKASPNASSQVSYLVTFSESVTGVDAGDFSLTTVSLTGASVGSVSGTGATRAVIVNTGTGDGTIRLDLIDNDSILDLATNPLNGSFTTGEIYTIDKPLLPAPVLRSPRTNLMTNNIMPTFWWTKVKGGQTYEIQFATNSIFTTGVVGDTPSGTSHTVSTPFGDGLYYWHVRALTASSQTGAWSAARIFTIDTSGPAAPTLVSPADSASTSAPNFRWDVVPTAVSYELEYDDNIGFTSPTHISNIYTNSRRPPAMSAGTYYWQVRAKDATGNWGPWTTVPFTVIITAP